MAQAFEKVNVSLNLAKKRYTFPKFSFWRNPAFSKVFDQKKTPYPSRQGLVQPTPTMSCRFYNPPRSGPHELRNCREAAVPEKETKILEKGACGGRG